MSALLRFYKIEFKSDSYQIDDKFSSSKIVTPQIRVH